MSEAYHLAYFVSYEDGVFLQGSASATSSASASIEVMHGPVPVTIIHLVERPMRPQMRNASSKIHLIERPIRPIMRHVSNT